MARDRARLCGRSARRAWRPARKELDQRGLYPQHVRCLARLHGSGCRDVGRTRSHFRRARGDAAMTPSQGASGIAASLQPVTPAAAFDTAECEQFLIHEARLLDEARFDQWLSLFTSDAWYWVPSEPDQANPRDTISLIYDDRRLLETRVRRLASPRLYSQEPPSRTSRMIGNVTIEETGRGF